MGIQPKLLTLSEVARLTGLCRRELCRRVGRGEIAATRLRLGQHKRSPSIFLVPPSEVGKIHRERAERGSRKRRRA